MNVSIFFNKKTYWPIIVLYFMFFLVIGCGSNNDNKQRKSTFNESADRQGQSVELDGTLTAYIQSTVSEEDSDTPATLRTSQNLRGDLTITNLDDTSVSPQTLPVVVSLNTETWAVAITRELVLIPAVYQFDILIQEGTSQYVGTSTFAVVEDQTNTVPLTITPVIGNQQLTINQVNRLSKITFQYPAQELSQFTTPQIGVSIDGGDQTMMPLNKTTGSTEVAINLVPGIHDFKLKFYDGSFQKGKSKPEQETQNVVQGQALTMDLVALKGIATFAMTENGGDLAYTATLPSAIVEEVGTMDKLRVMLSISGTRNAYQQVTMSVEASGLNYSASATFSGIFFETANFSMDFYDNAQNVLLGSCLLNEVVVDSNTSPQACDLSLIRNAVAGGSLLTTIQLNAEDNDGNPVAGASISIGGKIVGMTDAAGQALIFANSGAAVIISVEKGWAHKEVTVALDVLGVINQTVVLPMAFNTNAIGGLNPFDSQGNLYLFRYGRADIYRIPYGGGVAQVAVSGSTIIGFAGSPSSGLMGIPYVQNDTNILFNAGTQIAAFDLTTNSLSTVGSVSYSNSTYGKANLAIDNDGNIYGGAGNTIIHPDGSQTTTSITNEYSVVTDDYVYQLNTPGSQIKRYNKDGSGQMVYASGFGDGYGLAMGLDGSLYVGQGNSNPTTIYKIPPGGGTASVLAVVPSTLTMNLVCDQYGNLYVSGYNTVYRINLSTEEVEVYGTVN